MAIEAERALPERVIPTDKVCQLIVLAREFDVKDAEADPESGSNGTDDRMIDVLESHSDDPVEAEIAALHEAMSEDEKLDVVTMLWVGRGDGTLDEWQTLREQAKDYLRLDYLLGQPLISDYLEEALSLFGESCADFSTGRL